ncbi:DUF488 domain-containing protein [Lampropedia puyangensis]|uniref:DUF488 domain-containing protein n=1 Tax=Lampropedia puyangensis TaxID=1330072 RepID=UPI002452FEEB|nr:DUF488 family protein [Lampropedia puyangensis]
MSKAQAHLNLWCKDIAPSSELRKWFDHRAERFAAFSEEYRQELEGDQADLLELQPYLQAGPVSLIYAARDSAINHARVLQAWLLLRRFELSSL